MVFIPEYILTLFNTLEQAGHQAYLVGGCVRDRLLGLEPHDYDLASSASPEEISRYFSKTVPVGARHGTVLVFLEGQGVEITTFKGSCSLHPPDVAGTLEEDLARRDFSINAMAMDTHGKVYDPWGGQRDLADRILRATRDKPDERIMEDPLRMMRAIRLSIDYDLTIEPATWDSILRNSSLLNGVSMERIRDELNRILLSRQPAQGLRMLQQSGLMACFIPELALMAGFDQRNFRHDKDLFEHSMAVLDGVPPRLKIRLAALLHDIGKPASFTLDEKGIGHFYGHHLEGIGISKQILQRLKYERLVVEDVSRLVGAHMTRFAHFRDAPLKKLIVQLGESNLEDLFALQRADILGSAPPFEFDDLNKMQKDVHDILMDGAAMELKDLAVKGSDLIALGYSSGPAIGEGLAKLLELVLDDPSRNDRDILLNIARDWL